MNTHPRYPHVFAPLKVGNLTLKNRIQFTPMVCCLNTSNGEVTGEYVEFLGMQARTGASLVTIGATSVDHETGSDCFGEISVVNDLDIAGLYRIAEEVHRYGAKISVELMHAGRGADPKLLKTPYALAPSVFPIPHGRHKYVKEMDHKEIEHIIKCFADCAYRCMQADFDMVMIHAAHGNLIAQFLSPLTNRRTDNYGGSLENRMRFPLEVLQAVREKVGNKIGLEMRISGDEIIEGGQRIEEVLEFLQIARKYIDLVHMSSGLIVDWRYANYVMAPHYHPHAHNLKYAEAAKKALDIPVATFGGITTIELAEQILASGKADIVGMARQFLADPNVLKNAYRCEEEKTRACLRCLDGCAKHTYRGLGIRCSVNPVVGRENRYKEITPAIRKKKAVVVGGGPAGMMAAQVLTQRGHEVVLYERDAQLGGKLNDISLLSVKDDMRRYTAWNIRTTMECGAKIILNTEVTPEIIEKEKPDALFIAVGSIPFIPDIPGIDGPNVKHVLDVDKGVAHVGQKVVICGAGSSGLECAVELAMQGREVTVVDMIPLEQFGKDMWVNTQFMCLDSLSKHNAMLIGSHRIEKIMPNGVEIIDRNWVRTTIEADTIVAAFGMQPNSKVVESLFSFAYDTYIIGDCDKVKDIHRANHSAFNYAVEF